MQTLPKNEEFEVRVAASSEGPKSQISAVKVTRAEPHTPGPPQSLEIHRTDPRTNENKPDGSVCIDVHWSHAHADLKVKVTDVFFKISHQYVNESAVEICQDEVGERKRHCGTPIHTFSDLPRRMSLPVDSAQTATSLSWLRPLVVIGSFRRLPLRLSRHPLHHL